MKKAVEILDKIVDKVLAYDPGKKTEKKKKNKEEKIIEKSTKK